MNQISSIKRPRAGRPTKEQARERQEALLDCAIEHFLKRGFDGATVEAIAVDVSMTKRTVYARYPDKAAIFRAAVHRAIERFAISQSSIEATRTDSLAETLTNIAMLRIELVASAEGLRLQHIINTESFRFPEIFSSYYEIAALPTVRFLTDVLRSETEAGRLSIAEPELAANTFMSMVVGGPVRFITSGNPLSQKELKHRVAFAVNLFLEGAKAR